MLAVLKKLSYQLICLILLSTLWMGCGSRPADGLYSIDPAVTQCNPGAVEILVGDAFMEILCGCTGANEGSGTIFSAPGGLTCHLPSSNSTVFFFFNSLTLQHQIVSTGANTFDPTPVSDPRSSNPIRSWGITFSKPATTYSFVDIFNGMTGQIITP
jgi:hypothetical protein